LRSDLRVDVSVQSDSGRASSGYPRPVRPAAGQQIERRFLSV